MPCAYAWKPNNLLTIPNKYVDPHSSRQFKVITEPLGKWSSDIKADVGVGGSQTGYIEATGVVGVNAGNVVIALSGGKITWTGKMKLSGGGMSQDIISKDTFTASAPDLVLQLWDSEEITYDFEKIATGRNISIDSFFTLGASIHLEIWGTGIGCGSGSAVWTSYDDTNNSSFLELNGFPWMICDNYKIQ